MVIGKDLQTNKSPFQLESMENADVKPLNIDNRFKIGISYQGSNEKVNADRFCKQYLRRFSLYYKIFFQLKNS